MQNGGQLKKAVAAQKKELIKAMKISPACIPHLYNKLIAIGMDTETAPAGVGGTTAHSRHHDAVSRRQSRSETQLDPATGTAFFGIRVYRMERMSIHLLKVHVLKVASPCALSEPNVNASLTYGKADENKEDCLRYATFASGLSPAFEIEGEFREIAVFEDYVEDESKKRGDRAHSLKLKPNWPSDGIFAIVEANEDQLNFILRVLLGGMQRFSGMG